MDLSQAFNKTIDDVFVAYSEASRTSSSAASITMLLADDTSLTAADDTSLTAVGDNSVTAADDQVGAMLFVVITVCVYSLGIVAFIASHLYKNHERKIQDMQISDYLASVRSLSLARTERMDTIRHVQYKLPVEYRNLIEQKCYQTEYATIVGKKG